MSAGSVEKASIRRMLKEKLGCTDQDFIKPLAADGMVKTFLGGYQTAQIVAEEMHGVWPH